MVRLGIGYESSNESRVVAETAGMHTTVPGRADLMVGLY